MSEELEELVERTKERPGYIFSLGLQLAMFFYVTELIVQADKLPAIIAFSMFGYLVVSDFAPRMGHLLRDAIDSGLKLYRSFKRREETNK